MTLTTRLRNLSIILSLCLFLLPQTVKAGNALLQIPGPTALVRIRLSDESKASGLDASIRQSALPLSVYARLYPEPGGLDLILAASPELQQALSLSGYPVQVLDPDIQGAGYYLLSRDAADLPRAGELTRLLLVEGDIAIARVEPAQLDELAGLGLRLTRLAPKPLILPRHPTNTPEIPTLLTPKPLVQQMIAQVSSSTLSTYVGNLSGVSPVMIGNTLYTLATRFTYTDVPMTKATRYAYEYFTSLGLSTSYHNYGFAGTTKRNVIAEQLGLANPDKIYLLIAHLDDTSSVNGNPMTQAPGADDNASGSAAVMHIASILKQYEFNCTLRYALVTGEEQGLYGSNAYATEIYNNHENLLGVLNLDMLGYNTAGSEPKVELDARQYSSLNAGDLAIANIFTNTVSAYSIQLMPYVLKSGETGSDHASFWAFNYPAILAIEDWNDHTPFYHRTGDQLGSLNLGYYTEFVKAALATFAHMGCLIESSLAGTVRDQTSGSGIPGATVEAWQDGNKISSTTSLNGGAYELALLPGSYTIQVSATDHRSATFSTVVVNAYQTTQLNVNLQACITVKGTAFQVSTLFPSLSQTVAFTATVTAGEAPISYTWNFGDSGSANGANVTHAFSIRGVYPVTLTANNTCLVPQSALTNIFAGTTQIYIPIGMKNAPP
jgi:Zn-dependent M28 family amino/carboxypeptidase